MLYFILIGISLILFGGFLVLTAFEQGRGLRVAGKLRNRLDAKVARLLFIIAHVDWPAFTRHLVGSTLARIAHDVTHATLVFVRSLERLLTQTVRQLRERREHPQVQQQASGYLGTIVARLRQALAHARAVRRTVRPRQQEGAFRKETEE